MRASNVQLFRLDGRVALVTGASRGIGEAIARRLAEAGAHVVVTSRNLDSCARVVALIEHEGGRASAHACHIGNPDQISSTFDAIAEQHGRLDILVSNAATNPYFGAAADVGIDALQKTIDVNIRGYFLCMQHAVKLMARHGSGSIINVASISAVVPGPSQGVYSMTKAAVVSMTKVFAAECASQGIRVNAILPGITDTRFSSALVNDPKMLDQYLPRVPLRRVAQPDEMAGTALYLASDASSYTTGACLPVDGGYLVN